jgi:hypothetical protein
MARVQLSSSAIRSVEFNDGMLTVEFTGGSLVEFMDVPANVYNGLVQSPSPGRYFAENIRDRFKTSFTSSSGKRPGAKRKGPKAAPKTPGHLNPWYDPHGTRFGRPAPTNSPRAIRVRRTDGTS